MAPVVARQQLISPLERQCFIQHELYTPSSYASQDLKLAQSFPAQPFSPWLLTMLECGPRPTEPADDVARYEGRAARMVGRWAGVRGTPRPDKQPSEGVHSREEAGEAVQQEEDIVLEPARYM